MLIKTPEFNEKFVKDLSTLIFNSKMYMDVLNENSWKKDYNYFLETKNLFKNVNFIGSYPGKKYNEPISDIDVVQNVYINEKSINRFQQIIKKMSLSNFKFIRFYCGIKENLRIPWTIDEKGNCNFSLENTYRWVDNIRSYIPDELYIYIHNQLIVQNSISMKDLIQIEKSMEPYTSLSWTEDNIINGYKDENGVRYNLLDTFQKNKMKNVIKILYVYTVKKANGQDDTNYCFVDMSLNWASINKETLYAYYLNENYKKFKGLKFHLPDEIKTMYRNELTKNIGNLNIIYSNLELINKVHKYNTNNRLISINNMNNLIQKFIYFASQYNFYIDRTGSIFQQLKKAEIDIKKLIEDECEVLYEKYRKFVTNNYHLKLMLFNEIRAEEGSIKINKFIINKRVLSGNPCPFFLLSEKELEKLILVSLNYKLDAFKFVKCVVDVSLEYKKKPSSIVKLMFSDPKNIDWLEKYR